ncbi:hypothetical protein GCM10011491_41770 [Brucella endophytica]|uniref:Uncharacterized protein n=1 Tax=Brucella endophytica TaxID=1963359 RepID=A0A916SPP8_9HYPH|nr:hypothetical protein [Brucella endophytica]GGB09438.1 hypothetical protein GCM10011491_41770 [Brucella endophytica]
MAQTAALESSLDRYQQIVGKISESMRSDPQLKAAFDEKSRPAIDAIASAGEGNTKDRDLAGAERARAQQAQAAENAEAHERAARTAIDPATARDNADKARQFRAIGARAGVAAESAEANLRAAGDDTHQIRERAEQIVRGDEYRPDVAISSQNTDNDHRRTLEHVNAARKPEKRRTL